MKAKKPKQTPEERALMAAQTRELARQEDQITERKRRIMGAQRSGRASLLSGGERGVMPGEVRSVRGAGSGMTGGRTSTGGKAGGMSLLGGGVRSGGGGGGSSAGSSGGTARRVSRV